MVYRWIYYEIIEKMKNSPKTTIEAFQNLNLAMINFKDSLMTTKTSIDKARFAILSKQIGRTVRNENQYNLALLGADQETIDTNIPAEAYRLTISYGSAGRLKEALNILQQSKPETMKTRIKETVKKVVAFLKTLPSACAYAIHR